MSLTIKKIPEKKVLSILFLVLQITMNRVERYFQIFFGENPIGHCPVNRNNPFT